MIVISEIRRKHLHKLVDAFGGVTSFAAHIKKSKSQISQWLNASPDSKTGNPRNISDKSARYIEKQCGKPGGYLDTSPDRLDLAGDIGLLSNATKIKIKGFYPVISDTQARDWDDIYGDFSPNESTKWVGCDQHVSPKTYGLTIRGDAMTSAHGVSFTHGCKVVVDPGQRKAVNTGDKVVARLEGVDGVLFRVFIEDAGKRFLKPLNPQYDNIAGDFEILGKVIQKIEDIF